MAQPLLSRLVQRFAGARIDVLAPPWVRAVLARMPEVSDILDSPFAHGQLRLAARWRLARQLAERRYERAYVLPNTWKSALIPFLAGIPMRTGFIGECRLGLLNDVRRLDKTAYPLMVERFALLAEPPGAPLRRPLSPPRLLSDAAARAATLADLGLTLDRPVVALCPGAEYGPAKRWPPEHFGALARMLHERGFAVWLIGSPKDVAIGHAVNAHSGDICRNLCGATSLAQAIDLIACAEHVVTNDSGLMHVAAALGRPLVALYGSSSPGFTPPLSSTAQILSLNLPCSPCFERACPLGHVDCLRKLGPERVLAALKLAAPA